MVAASQQPGALSFEDGCCPAWLAPVARPGRTEVVAALSDKQPPLVTCIRLAMTARMTAMTKGGPQLGEEENRRHV